MKTTNRRCASGVACACGFAKVGWASRLCHFLRGATAAPRIGLSPHRHRPARRQYSLPLGAAVVTLRDRLGSSVHGEPLKMSLYPESPPPLLWTVETEDRLLWAQGERGEFSPTLRPSALESRLARLSVAELDKAMRTLGVPGRSLGGKFRRVALLMSIAVKFLVVANEKECSVLKAEAVDLIHDMLFPKPAQAAAVGPAVVAGEAITLLSLVSAGQTPRYKGAL